MNSPNENNHNKYIEFLDKHKTYPHLTSTDIITIINTSNLHYSLVCSNFQKTQREHEISKWLLFELQPPLSLPLPLLLQKEQVLIDEQIVSIEKRLKELEEIATQKKPKEKINIEDTINNVGDLLHILKTYIVDDTKEYNIDLVKLNSVKPELEELNNMIGMEELKSSIIDQLFYFMQDLHLSPSGGGDFKHTVIYGPPGTGKTEIAKIMGRMFSKIGILKNNVFKKVVRNDLVAGYLGQTAIKTSNVIKECLGGVLFIDEAYSLASSNESDSYSHECIDTLCEALSAHKDNLMVIVAGYEDEMNNLFFKANKGLHSRFIWRFKIESYSAHQLSQIFQKNVHDAVWTLHTVPSDKWFDSKKDVFLHFGRDMEILFLYTKICHARRIYGKQSEVRKSISLDDLEAGFKMFQKNIHKKEAVKYPHFYL
jgi:Cdc6-like AAA superfamily ATPase